ncbi:Sushi, von Willebrand factor type A, EGF and pentraxin domain-containing protein 1 [Stylophora pistillata]|uniref:Sushi, von Willebrand factor type A, EGF and pentraxin domain-containing protein 1 n=1 Tax=Stylophora pistillata TaxID=50429 RepID=A0A2B4SJB3_STYPI|nr:Sushi, von Willebrand factor type A, EGF and pentraxin domain-containing protein 1 [Stylophora pistillata]
MNGFIRESYKVNMIKHKTDGDGMFEGHGLMTSMNQSLLFAPLFQGDVRAGKWVITLKKRIWVFSAAVDIFVNCCDQHTKWTKMLVSDGNMFDTECEESVIFNSSPATLAFRCTPPRRGTHVLLEFLGQLWNLRVSSVAVSGFADEAATVNMTREIPPCHVPLGMQNGQIPNASVITSSNLAPLTVRGCTPSKRAINLEPGWQLYQTRTSGSRAIPLLEATSPLLDDGYMQREAAIRRCAKAAYDLQFDIFAVQNGGQCKGGIRPHLNYKKYGKSTQCQGNGPGGPWENQVSKISRKCNASDEWCGWMSLNDTKSTWSLTEAADLVKAGKSIAEYAHHFNVKENLNDRRYALETNRNMQHRITTPLSIGTSIDAMTICYWLQDNFVILSLKYTSDNNTKETASFSLHHSVGGVRLTVKEIVILSRVSTDRNVWHHVCASWSFQLGLWKIYKDGVLFDFNRWLSPEQVLPGSGVAIIEFQQDNQTFLSRLTGVNMWDLDIGMEEVYRLSLGCGHETGKILRWFDLKDKVDMTEDEKKLKESACSYRDGK